MGPPMALNATTEIMITLVSCCSDFDLDVTVGSQKNDWLSCMYLEIFNLFFQIQAAVAAVTMC